MHTVRLLRFVPVLALLASAACNPQVDGSTHVQTFDVGTSGTESCPGTLYDSASSGLAQCSRAPERCISQSGASTIVCTCADSDGGTTGEWECHEGDAFADGG